MPSHNSSNNIVHHIGHHIEQQHATQHATLCYIMCYITCHIICYTICHITLHRSQITSWNTSWNTSQTTFLVRVPQYVSRLAVSNVRITVLTSGCERIMTYFHVPCERIFMSFSRTFRDKARNPNPYGAVEVLKSRPESLPLQHQI